MLIGRIQQIWRHPEKSMAGERLNECMVAPSGIPGDRGWALRDETTGEITNGKRYLCHGCKSRVHTRRGSGRTALIGASIYFASTTITTGKLSFFAESLSAGNSLLTSSLNSASYRSSSRFWSA
jgi:uncharacterized protein YcbX